MRRVLRSPATWAVVALAAVLVAMVTFRGGGTEPRELRLDELIAKARAGEVATARILERDHAVEGRLNDGTSYRTSFPRDFTEGLTNILREQGGIAITSEMQREPLWSSLLFTFLPLIVLMAFIFFLLARFQGGRFNSFGRSRGRRPVREDPDVRFGDVAGADEAVEEVRELRDFLRDPKRYVSLGAKVPRGVLLYGPPGTGKTLLARAIAGEAGVPFFSISGSDFVEMFVGVGAARVRDLFDQAKKAAPAIVFIDELDAVGRQRGTGVGGGHDEREQTLNQLLVEMDGFDPRTGVILVAATNRPDILDPALLRPGRIDRQVVLDRPDRVGRRAILEVHAKGKPLGPDTDLDVVARQTPGLTGADLANVLNEATLISVRRHKVFIGMVEIEEAIQRVLAGPERRTRMLSDRERTLIAYHEAGHALVAHALPHADPVHRISIIPRGTSLGHTMMLPTEDRYIASRAELRDQLATLMGGRVAEELVFSDPSTGAADDIEKATAIARRMVCEFGMSDVIGPLTLGHKDEEVFLGRDLARRPDYSDAVAAEIDAEIRALIDAAHDEALEILGFHRTPLDRLAERLLDVESLEASEVARLLESVPKWEALANGSRHRPISPRRMRIRPT